MDVRLILLTFALGMGTFIQILDTSIANVAIPYIAGDLGVSPNEGTWVITSFAVSNAIILPLTGWLSRRFSDVRLFILSTASFSIASWLCGLAWSLPSLLFFRVIQGATGGALIPLSQSLLLQNFPADKKGVALGIWSMIVIVAPILGPILGGWITDNYGWRWIFYINIPIGLLSSALTTSLMGWKHETEPAKMDIVGFLLLFTSVATLQVFLDQGNQLDWFSSNEIIILAVVSLLSFILFIPWNLLSPDPIVDFRAFKNRNFVFGTTLISIGYFIFFGSIVLLPLWLQTQMGYTAFWAGLVVAPIGIAPLFLSILVGQSVNRIDPRYMVSFSFLVFAYTFFWYAQFNTDISLNDIIIPRLIQGIGVAFFFIPLVTISLSEIPKRELSGASGLSNFIRLIAGGGFGTSIFVTLWTRREQFHHARLGESLTAGDALTTEALTQIRSLGLPDLPSYALLDQVVSKQAFMLSTNDLFFLAGIGFLLLIPLVWLSKPTQQLVSIPHPIGE